MDDNVIESAVGDIHVPQRANKSTPIDTSIEFTPQNPFTVDIPGREGAEAGVAYPGFPIEPEKTGLLRTALDEFQETSSEYHVFHAANAPLTKPAGIQVQYFYPEVNDKFYHPAPPGWSPKQEIEKLSNDVDPKFLPKLMATKNPDDFNYTLNSINDETTRTHELQNGSTLAKILGGFAGLTLGSLENFIPLTSIATKAKVGVGFVSGLLKSTPGILGASAIHEGAIQMDKIDGNLPDFLKDTFIDTAFGMTFFGIAGAGKTLLNMSELNRLKQFARDSLDGIGFNFKVDKEGNLKGFEAVDTSGGSLSAARVTRAQEQADAAFYKGGLFKIPYVGDAAIHVLSGNLGNLPGIRNVPVLKESLNYLLGSPLIRIKTSKYKSANAFADAGFDHFITTEGEAKGEIRPPSFELKVKKTRAMLTDLYMQTNALHAEANGYTITARPTLAIQNAWSAVKQKTIEQFSKESNSNDWMSKTDFMDKVQNVMVTGNAHENAAINTAAAMYRKVFDDTGHDYLAAHNLPKDYFRNMDTYVSRVYDTKYMNDNEVGPNGWVPVISKWFADSDAVITARMKPINELTERLKNAKPEERNKLKVDLKISKEKLQNELRSNPDFDYHVEDRLALSADESKELTGILQPLKNLEKQIEEQKNIISSLKGKNNSSAKKVAEEKLNELKRNHEDEKYNLYDKARNGQINPRLYNPLTHEFRDPNVRLKFRDVFTSQSEREITAKSSYDSIMNMHPEDVIADIFGKVMGNSSANPLKKRTLLIPDEILYNNNFLTKDLYAKTANYVNYLSKRTHLKTSFDNVTVNGNFEELASDLSSEYQAIREVINGRLEKLTDPKEIKKEKKNLVKERLEFDSIKNDMEYLFKTRMMGINKREKFIDTRMAKRSLMSLSAMSNLHNLPATQITDIAFAGFQHGIWPSIRDGIYPILESLGGILKTKDSEALRKMAPHLNLGLQDMLNNYADRNWSSELQPDINMGKIVSGIEKVAHFSALTDLTPYIDNGIQRMNGSIIQSQFMELLHKQVEGTLSNKESLYLRKYGIDPKVWAKRMTDTYKDAGGFKTKLGGYMGKSWEWQDLEAANIFNDAVFRGIQNTLVWKGMADSPFFADNILGMFFHTFTGWTYAATNRYLIPAMQHADGEMLLKMIWMMGAGALVSPTRRISRGEDAWPEDMTPEQHAYEAWSDSGVFSTISNVLNISNFLSDDKLLGNLKNDKYKNRVKSGIFGMSDIISSTASRISDVIGMANSGIDEKDLKTAAHMLPITGAMYGHYLSDKLIESWNLPRNKRAAQLDNG